MSSCPCGLEKAYSKCCEPIIKGKVLAETAEQLMRSRYSAYAKKEMDYLKDSILPVCLADYDHESATQWAENSIWQGLDIITTDKGSKDDIEGQVEFIAHFTHKGVKQEHHEMATFKKQKERWYFCEGEIVKQKQVIRVEPKIGRNDPCPCKSGKKYKKCCGL